MDLTLVDEPAASQPRTGPGSRWSPAPRRAGSVSETTASTWVRASTVSTPGRTPPTRASPGRRATTRQLLQRLMTDAGFVNYDREWWHYSLRDEPYPDTFFAAPVARSSVG
ncbi:M15 family metallopeptidase [Micromonospora sp. M12]